MNLTVRITEKSGSVFFIKPVGSIDSSTYTLLQDKINETLENNPKVIVLNMKEVTYISSMGVGVILKAEKDLQNRGSALIMANLQHRIKKVFDIINALPEERIFSSIEELDRYLSKIQQDNT